MQALSCMFRSSRLVCKRHIAGALLRRRRSRQLWRSSLRRWPRWRFGWCAGTSACRASSISGCFGGRAGSGSAAAVSLARSIAIRSVHLHLCTSVCPCSCLCACVCEGMLKALEGSIGGSWCGDCGRRRVCYSVEQPIAGVVSSQATADAPTRVLFRDHTV